MTTNDEHLSMFALDLYFAANAPDPRIEEHVSGCERCRAYLSRLAALQAGAPLPTPAEAPHPVRAGGTRLARALTFTAALAILGTLVALLASTPDADAPAVAVKGSPAVQLLVRRGDETRPWDGESRVHAGDRLGLRVACDGFDRVAVAARAAAPGSWVSLSEAACPAAGGALPFTLVVDDTPGRERFAVVFSASTLDAVSLSDAIERRRLDSGAWVTRFELGKEVAR
jgi:hypothetical protein